MDNLAIDMTSQSSSYLDEFPENFKEDDSGMEDVQRDGGEYFDGSGNLVSILSLSAKPKKLEALLEDKPASEESPMNSKKKFKKPKLFATKDLMGSSKISVGPSKVSVKKNFQISSEPAKKWTLVEADQETLFGGKFKKKVWICNTWSEEKKQERLRGFVWTDEVFEEAARTSYAVFDDQRNIPKHVISDRTLSVPKKKKKKKKTTPDPPEIMMAMSELQRYGKTLDDGSAVCTYPGCNKKFANISSFRKHRKSHAPKCHTCEVCGRSFTENSKLRRHYVVHTGEKPYQVANQLS